MSFAKAQDLLRLALMASTRHFGVSLEDIRAEFSVSHRTAQRMTDALELTFANVTKQTGSDRRSYWKVDDPTIAQLQPHQETAVEAMEIAIRRAKGEGRLRHAQALEDTRNGLMLRLSARDAKRAETDAEAVLEALGQVTRPGPRVPLNQKIADAVTEGLRGPFRLEIIYSGRSDQVRTIEPYGLLLGPRSYLIAKQPNRGAELLNFRMDRIQSAKCLDEWFIPENGFSIENYAAQAFGAYHDPDQLKEVVWRFKPEAAERASEFQFHPKQTLQYQADGSLIVRFTAAGWLEMSWFLYEWGDAVEVIDPPKLRDFVQGYQRVDFPSLP